MKEQILNSLQQVEEWVEKQNYKGYEPFDGLSSFLRPLTFGNLFLDRILMQLVRQSPINLRPLFGVKPLDSTIGRGYMAWGYKSMLDITNNNEYETKLRNCLDWLIDNKSPGSKEYCWGKHFDFASRGGRYPKFEPITVWTCLIGMAFLDAYEFLGDEKYLNVCISISRWIMDLGRNKVENGICLSYTNSNDTSTIHNHNMLAAAFLAGVSSHTNNSEMSELAEQAMKFSCSHQLLNGAWYYGEEEKFHWIDNFHTGYNLDSLKYYISNTGNSEYKDNLHRGLKFYLSHFFEESGRPRYYHNRTYPVDSQCISQSIDSLANMSEVDPSALDLALKVSQWAISNMQDRKGFFYYRQYPLIKAKTPMLHWSQATMYKALCRLLEML